MTTSAVSVLSLLGRACSAAVRALKKDRRIYFPFLVFAGIEAAFFLFWYLAPREPLRAATGPFISTLWGEKFLHYPRNFMLLPKLAALTRLTLSVLIGSLLTGISVGFFFKKTAAAAFRKYADLLMLVLVMTVLYGVMNKVIFHFLVQYFKAGHPRFLLIGPQWWLGPFGLAISQGLALVVQGAFAYVVPILLTTDRKFMGAVAGSFIFFIRNLRVTLFLVGIPLCFTMPLMLLDDRGAVLMSIFSPEVIMWLGFLGIVINSLIVDPMITLSTAAFYAESRPRPWI